MFFWWSFSQTKLKLVTFEECRYLEFAHPFLTYFRSIDLTQNCLQYLKWQCSDRNCLSSTDEQCKQMYTLLLFALQPPMWCYKYLSFSRVLWYNIAVMTSVILSQCYEVVMSRKVAEEIKRRKNSLRRGNYYHLSCYYLLFVKMCQNYCNILP